MKVGLPPLSASGGAQHILVVDDDPDVLYVVRPPLEEEGFEVSTAGSAAQALDWLERHGLPHLAIVDIVMPEVSGLELCRQIQEYSDLPVIMLTAVDEDATVVNTIREVAEVMSKTQVGTRVLLHRARVALQPHVTAFKEDQQTGDAAAGHSEGSNDGK